MRYDITHAIRSLHPNATWRLHGFDYSGLVWLDIQIDKPEEAALLAEVERLQAAWDRNEYARKRAAEYPPIFDYLDAVVKNDQGQMNQYISDCLTVKAKYPKPE